MIKDNWFKTKQFLLGEKRISKKYGQISYLYMMMKKCDISISWINKNNCTLVACQPQKKMLVNWAHFRVVSKPYVNIFFSKWFSSIRIPTWSYQTWTSALPRSDDQVLRNDQCLVRRKNRVFFGKQTWKMLGNATKMQEMPCQGP